MNIIFCNIGWMESYQGLNPEDLIRGGGSYVDEEGRGHEVCNFYPHNNTFYGYVQAPGGQININRLGAHQDDEHISGINVIWTATRPTGGTAVIGWYKNATVYRYYQKHAEDNNIFISNGIDGYWITASINDGRLLPVDERTLEIRRQVKGGMGRANIWYADKPANESIVNKVIALINDKKCQISINTTKKSKQDQNRKIKIEKIAISQCISHFKRIGYTVTSVEKDNLGWDLEATSGKTIIQIEVKGLSGDKFSIELTPNEYKAFSEQSDKYRLAVVTNTLESPNLYICRYSKEKQTWLINESEDVKLKIETKQSASIKL